MFLSLEPFNGGSVIFRGGTKGQIIGSGQVKLNQKTMINDVNLLKNLKFDLLSVSKLCDNGRNKLILLQGGCCERSEDQGGLNQGKMSQTDV